MSSSLTSHGWRREWLCVRRGRPCWPPTPYIALPLNEGVQRYEERDENLDQGPDLRECGPPRVIARLAGRAASLYRHGRHLLPSRVVGLRAPRDSALSRPPRGSSFRRVCLSVTSYDRSL